MSKTSEWMHEELEGLRQLRDELRVQAELGRAEMRERFEHLEKRWHDLEGKLKVIADGAREDLDEVREAAGMLAGELRHGYENMKKRL
jgi:hypothetical protein